MKKTTIKLLTVLMSIGVFSVVQPAAHAQTPTKIDWDKNGRSQVWDADMAGKSTKIYTFQAYKGQKLTLGFIDDTNIGSMDMEKYSVQPNGDPTSITIDTTKEYTITLVNNSPKRTSFRVTFELLGSKTIYVPKDAERINFPAGTIEQNLERVVEANGAKRFAFSAKVGQEVSITVTPKTATAKIDVVFGPRNVVIPLGKTYSIGVGTAGTFLLQVTNFEDRSRGFTLDIGVADKPKPTVANKPKPPAASDIKRLKIAAGKQDTNIVGMLGPYQSNKYLIYVPKGNMITIVPDGWLAPNVKVRLDNKEFDFRNSTTSEHQTEGNDHLVEIYNIANADHSFGFNVGFSEG